MDFLGTPDDIADQPDRQNGRAKTRHRALRRRCDQLAALLPGDPGTDHQDQRAGGTAFIAPEDVRDVEKSRHIHRQQAEAQRQQGRQSP